LQKLSRFCNIDYDSMGAHRIDSESQTNLLDSEIWKNFKSGDKKALSTIYTRYFDNLYNYGSRITNDSNLTEDSIQDLFVEFWNKRKELADVKSIKYYLYQSLRRKIIYKISVIKKQKISDELNHFEIQLTDKSHFLTHAINSEIRQRVNLLVNTLLPKQKEAIFLIYYDELSYEEVANIMGLKVKTVYNLVHQAISKLREQKSSLSSFSFLFVF
jgi:RNA polymerase sigma factor (sigma-70 family)